MEIHLPNSAFLGNIDPFLRQKGLAGARALSITANKKWIALHPMVLSMVAALGKQAGTVRCEKLEARSKHYLERMGLFSLLDIPSQTSITEHESAGRFIPLRQVRNGKKLSAFITDMVPLLHLEPRHAEPIRYIISELVRNVLEHAKAKHGAFVCAQYYKKSNRIGIGIADRGCGIKESISQSHRVADDAEAIRLALMPGITGKTRREGGTELNAGAGLFFIKSIAQVNRDFFVVYSGDTMYKLLKKPEQARIVLHADPFQDKHKLIDDLAPWTGTVVGIDLSLERTAVFSVLLDEIRKTYIKSVKERKKTRYRRPRFT